MGKGTRYNLAGLNYDLCEAEFNKLSEDEKTKFVVIARQGDRPVPYGQKAGVSNQETETESDDEDSAKFNHFFKHLFGIDAAPAIHQIKLAFEDINAEMAKKFASQNSRAKNATVEPVADQCVATEARRLGMDATDMEDIKISTGTVDGTTTLTTPQFHLAIGFQQVLVGFDHSDQVSRSSKLR